MILSSPFTLITVSPNRKKNISILSILITVSLIYAPAGTSRDLILTTSASTFSYSQSAQYSYHTHRQKTHWEIGCRSVDFCWLQLSAQRQLLSTVQNMTRVFSSVSVRDYCVCMQASLWEKCVSPWAVSVSVLWFTRLGYAKLSTRPGKSHVN